MKQLKKTGTFLLVLAMLFTSFAVLTGNGLTEVKASSSKFPYNATYKYGFSSLADDQAAANAMLLAEWEDWKATYVTSSGAGGFRRVQRDAGSNFDTVSEGMGYGMILAVYFDDQALFDDFYSYVKLYHNGNGLMGWQIDRNGNIVGPGGKDCATDADEDIALALVFASKKWGSGKFNYGEEAKRLINNLYNYCVERGTNVLKPGDTWGGSQVTNPSYFAPAWYKIFAQFTGDNRWNSVADKCYEIVDSINRLNGGTGLVPDWCTAQGTQASGMGYNYTYDAARYPWRTAIDYSWFGDSRAKKNCDLIANFFKRQGGASAIVDGYTIQGSRTGQYHNATFIGPIASATMTGSDLNFAKELYNETINVKDGGDYHYYGNSLRLMTLLYLTGNFPNLLEDTGGSGPSTPYPTTTPTSSPKPTPSTPPTQDGELLIDDFEGAFTWITYDGEGASVSAAKGVRDGGGSAMDVSYSGSASGYWGVLKVMVGTDISKATGISFDIKGTGNQIRLMLVEEGSIAGEDGEQWEYVISPRNSWTTLEIPMSQFSPRSDWQPPGADGNKRLDLNKIISIHFAGMNANSGSFMVDNVKITGLPSTQPTPTQSPKPTPPGSYGDINGDGIINTSDYALLTRHILEIPVQNANLNNADLNGDGVVDSLDATILSRYLLEVIDRFPVQR